MFPAKDLGSNVSSQKEATLHIGHQPDSVKLAMLTVITIDDRQKQHKAMSKSNVISKMKKKQERS